MGAITTDELRLIISAEVDRALRDMERFEDQIEKTEKTAKASAVNWDKVSRSMMIFSAGVAAAGVGAVKFAADIEAQETAFGVLLGSVEKGTQLFAELKQFSASTPLQLQDITRGAQTLMAFGTEAANVQTELRMLGDAAMGNASKLDSLVRAYGKLQAKGRASLEELNMFTENGVPIMEQLALQTGQTTEEIFRMVSAGQIGFSDVQMALEALTSDGGKFAGMMETVSQTTTGKFSTALDNLKLSAAELGKELLPMANSVLDAVTKVAQKFTDLDDGTKKWILTLGGLAVAAGPISKIGVGLANVIKHKEKILGIAKTIGPVITNPWVLAGAAVATLTIASIKLAQTWRETRRIIEGGSSGDLGKDLEILSGQIDSTRAKIEELKARARVSEGAGAAFAGFDPAKLQEAEVALEHLLTRRQQVAEQIRAEEYQKRVEAGEILWMENAFKALDDAATEQTKTWQAWFNEIAGTSVDEGTTTGKAFSSAYLASLQEAISGKQVLAEALGHEFDAAAKEAEEIRTVLEKLFAIDPDEISEPFKIADASVKELVLRYRELTDTVNTDQTLLNRLMEDAVRLEQDRAEALSVYGDVHRDLTAAIAAGDTERIRLLAEVQEALDKILEKEGGVSGKIEEQADALTILQEEFAKTFSPENIGSSLLTLVEDVSFALAEGKSASEAFGKSFSSMASEIAGQISSFALAAGLRVIAETGSAGIPLALVLFGIAGISAAASGILKSGSSERSVDYASMIINEEERLAEERLRLLDETIKAEQEKRNEAIKALDKTFNQEYEVLRDAWNRNLISTEEFKEAAAAMSSDYATKETEAEAPLKEAEAAKAAEEKRKQDLEAARAQKRSELAALAMDLQNELNSMTAWDKFWSGRDQQILEELATIDRRIDVVNNATSIEVIRSAARGADFITKGEELLKVGDNPGGRERVTVTPLSSQNMNGPQEAAPVTILIQGDVYGIDDLYQKLEEAGKRLSLRRRTG